MMNLLIKLVLLCVVMPIAITMDCFVINDFDMKQNGRHLLAIRLCNVIGWSSVILIILMF